MKVSRLTELEKQWLALGSAAGALLLSGVLLMVVPTFKKASKLNQEASQVDSKIEVLKDIQVYSAQIREMEKGIQSFKEKHLVMEAVTGAANKNRLEVDTAQPEFDPVAKAGYRGAQVVFQGHGEFTALMRFLRDLDKIGFPVAINNIDLKLRSGNRKKESRTLDVRMQVATLMSTEGA